MAIKTWKQLIALPNPDLRILVEMNPGKHLVCGSGWTSIGSNTYSHECKEDFVNVVLDDGVQLAAKNSVSEVQATAGSWFYDFYKRKIYVHCFDNDDLSNSSTTVVILVLCWKNFSTDNVIFKGRPYKALVRQDSLPSLDLAVDDIVEGSYKFSFGSFRMINDGWFDKASEEYVWLNRKVVMRIGGEALPYEEYQLFFVGRVSDFYVSDEEVIFTVKDIRVGTYAQIPVDHYWLSNYPNMPEEFDGRPIALFYGEKENVVPVCIDADDQYTSVATGNNKGDTTFVVQGAIKVGTPASGRIVVVGAPTEAYSYSSWSGSTFNLAAGVTLQRDYTDLCKVYVVGTNRWKFAGRKIKEAQVKKNGKALNPATDYTMDLNTAEFVLKVSFDALSGDYLTIDGGGFVDESNNLIVKGADIAKDILKTELGYIDDDLDLPSFEATNSVRTAPLAIFLDTDESSREVLQTIGRSIVAFFSPTEGGKLSFEAYEPTVPLGTLELFDPDYKDWKVKKDDSFVRDKVRVLYDRDPKSGSYKVVERNNYEVLYKYGVRDTLALKTYLKNKADAENICEGLRDMVSTPITIAETSVGIKGFGLFPTRKVKMTRERGADISGQFDSKVFRVRSVGKDTMLERTRIVAMDDLQTLGAAFCYVCYSCQLCVNEEASCATCYSCQLCYTAQVGCEICVSCELCDTDQGGCQVCDVCQSCDTCETTVGSCETCQLCVSCQACDTCELNVAFCETCQSCYGCQVCNTCELNVTTCGTCESCVACELCDACQLNVVSCSSCQVCYSCQTNYSACPGACDVCVSCEACNTCQLGVKTCTTCQVCDSCQQTYTCASCDTCQVCVSAQDCATCDICNTCQVQYTCAKCDTCQVCVSAQDCVTCDVCNTCQVQYTCAKCNTCQVCVAAEDCTSCDVCDTCESYYTCAVCVACQVCNVCEKCVTCEKGV